MCGIAGYVSHQTFAPEVLARMTRALSHRGPDAEGFYSDRQAHLGHRRLSVIDLAGSAQPLFNEDKSVALVFNGEIYNFQALRRELVARGHRFQTDGDSEVLVHAYEEYGQAMLEKLSGMFAFAIWDKNKESLFLARDHLGVKPLYYYWDGALFAFASELKGVLAHPAVTREVDVESLGLYLECQYIPAPRSIFHHVKKLPAAHSLVLAGGDPLIAKYWAPSSAHKLDVTEDEALARFEDELTRSVRSMLVADVPLGAFISGGVDSGVVAALMTATTGTPIETFNLGFTNSIYSEHREAQRVADHIGSRHHGLVIEPRDVLAVFDKWVDVFDEPFGDQAALPTMLLANHARRHVTVVLTGEGADEILSGYGNYRKNARSHRLVSILGGAWSPLPALVRQLPARMRKDRLLKAISKPAAQRYSTISSVFDEMVHGTYFTPEFSRRAHTRLSEHAAVFFDECDSPFYIEKLMHIDARLWLPDDLLTKVDRATMASSLEARVPYLDHRFVEFCATLPPSLKQNGLTGKYILKKLATKYLPAEIVYRHKQGFVMPLDQWLANELGDSLSDCLGPAGILRRNLLRPEPLNRIVSEHRAGTKSHATRLWALMVLELWFQRYQPDFRL